MRKKETRDIVLVVDDSPETLRMLTDAIEEARAKFEKIRARDPELASKMLMAARNGQGLSDNDMEGMLEDLARLERLDGEDDEDGEK
jgi:DNA-binding NtrC family response regulator